MCEIRMMLQHLMLFAAVCVRGWKERLYCMCRAFRRIREGHTGPHLYVLSMAILQELNGQSLARPSGHAD